MSCEQENQLTETFWRSKEGLDILAKAPGKIRTYHDNNDIHADPNEDSEIEVLTTQVFSPQGLACIAEVFDKLKISSSSQTAIRTEVEDFYIPYKMFDPSVSYQKRVFVGESEIFSIEDYSSPDTHGSTFRRLTIGGIVIQNTLKARDDKWPEKNLRYRLLN
jgi:hypothetical protein